MNDEIKEFIEFRVDEDGTYFYYIDKNSDEQWSYNLDNLKDYITNLQQDIEMYAQLKDEYEEEIKDLQQENEYLKKQNDEKTKIGVADHKYASQMEDKVILLQQENERLKTIKPCMLNFQECYVVKDYKSRCEKAIEKIRKLGLEIQEDEGISWQIVACDEIINILQNGSDSQ